MQSKKRRRRLRQRQAGSNAEFSSELCAFIRNTLPSNIVRSQLLNPAA